MGKMKKYTDIILGMIYGCIIGVANIIPGVSGGTMAVMLNIYDKLIDSFTGIRKNFKKSMAFLVPVILGAVIGIVAFSVLIKYLINNHPLPTCFFFIGLILGSLPLVCKRALETKFKIWSVIPFIIFLAGMTALAFVNTEAQNTASTAAYDIYDIRRLLDYYRRYIGSYKAFYAKLHDAYACGYRCCHRHSFRSKDNRYLHKAFSADDILCYNRTYARLTACYIYEISG